MGCHEFVLSMCGFPYAPSQSAEQRVSSQLDRYYIILMPILITVLAVLAVYMIHKCRRFIKKTVHPRRVMKRNREILQASGLFRVISCLGMGRNGVVFEISQADSSGSSDTAAC